MRFPLVFLFVFVDILGFSLILPLLPFFRTHFDATPLQIGLLGSGNALAQLLAAPLIGVLSDCYGRRPLLLLCLAGTCLSFVMMALGLHSYWWVLASRILDGALGGNISLAQAYVSDSSEPGAARSRLLGLLMAAYGVGFTVGPAIGAALGGLWGRAGPVWLAAALSAANLIGVGAFLPESLPVERRAKALSLRDHPPATAALKFLSRPNLGALLVLRFVNGFVFTCIVETAFGFFNQERLGLSARQSSCFMAMVGLVYSFTQGGIARASRKYGRRALLHLALLASASGLALWSGGRSYWPVVVAALVYSAASGVANTMVYSLITQVVAQQNVGGTLGLSAAVGSLTRVVAPTLSGFCIQRFGIAAPHLVCCALLLISYPLVDMGIPESIRVADEKEAEALLSKKKG